MSVLEEFVQWHKGISKEMTYVSSELATPLSNEPEVLIQSLIDIEAWNGRVGNLLSEANSFLDRSKYELKPPKENGIEFDRKTYLDSAVAPVRLCRDQLENLRESIRQRLSLGQSIVKFEVQFIERTHKAE